MIPTVIISIICITTLESLAIIYGVDGALFGICIAAISGLGGYQLHKARTKPK